MNKKLIFLAVILSLIFSPAAGSIALAAETSTPKEMTVIASGQHMSDSEAENGLLFLFSSGSVNHKITGNVWLFFSKAEINSEIDGNVYLFFSELKLGPSAGLNGEARTVSSVLRIDSKIGNEIKSAPLLGILRLFLRTSEENGFSTIDDTITYINLLFSAIMIAFSYLAYAIKRGFIEQGAVLIYHEPLDLMRNGIITYFILLVMSVLFLATLFLAPLMLILLLFMIICLAVGESALSMVVGKTVMDLLNLKFSSLGAMMIGVLIIETLRNIPYISWGFSYIFFPMLACGITLTAIINGFVKKRFYGTSFKEDRPDKVHNFGDLQLLLRK